MDARPIVTAPSPARDVALGILWGILFPWTLGSAITARGSCSATSTPEDTHMDTRGEIITWARGRGHWLAGRSGARWTISDTRGRFTVGYWTGDLGSPEWTHIWVDVAPETLSALRKAVDATEDALTAPDWFAGRGDYRAALEILGPPTDTRA